MIDSSNLFRPTLKYFYYAFCRFPDIIQARRLLNDIKFPELHGKVCRALPYDKELLRSCEPKSNVFVKGFGVRWSHKDLHKAFEEFGPIVSARVSIKDNYESRGYGFVQFTNASSAERACQVVSAFDFEFSRWTASKSHLKVRMVTNQSLSL